MDGSRFDALSRSLAAGHSRRALTRALSGLAFSGTLARFGVPESAAKGKSHQRRGQAQGKKPCPACKKRKKGKCKGLLPDGSACAGGTCQRGSCLPTASPPPPPPCPDGTRPCRGTCLSYLICCDDTDCAGGRTCQIGTCACPADKPHECDGSTVCQQCCTVTDCRPATFGDAQECQNGQCVCTDPTTHHCPSGSRYPGVCGQCCNDSDCPGAAVCWGGAGSLPPRCRCFTDAMCEGVCIAPGCDNLCFAQCPQGVAIGQPCCSGTDALICREEAPGSGVGSCQL